jgi:hypothetical protein
VGKFGFNAFLIKSLGPKKFQGGIPPSPLGYSTVRVVEK